MLLTPHQLLLQLKAEYEPLRNMGEQRLSDAHFMLFAIDHALERINRKWDTFDTKEALLTYLTDFGERVDDPDQTLYGFQYWSGCKKVIKRIEQEL
jgi:hypothetical protein